LVWHHHCDDGRAGINSPAGRDECVCHQKRGARCEFHHDIQGCDSLYLDRPSALGDFDCLSHHCAVVARANGIKQLRNAKLLYQLSINTTRSHRRETQRCFVAV